jgi:protein-tyrosine phosphatase
MEVANLTSQVENFQINLENDKLLPIPNSENKNENSKTEQTIKLVDSQEKSKNLKPKNNHNNNKKSPSNPSSTKIFNKGAVTLVADLKSSTGRVLNFYKLKDCDSKITCHGRPTSKEIKLMKNTYGVNCVLTLQGEREKYGDIKKSCEENDIKWFHIELAGANVNYMKEKKTFDLLVKSLTNLYFVLKSNPVCLFTHCAAGLHRTGTIVYAILRLFGESPDSALQALEYIRVETRKEVGEQRLEFSEKFLVVSILKNIQLVQNSQDAKITQMIK